jgi:MFS family permease
VIPRDRAGDRIRFSPWTGDGSGHPRSLFVTGIGIGCISTLYLIALGDTSPDEAGSASGALSSIQQLAAGIGSAGVTSIFFSAATSGLGHAMRVTLVVVLLVTAVSIPVVALMPRKAAHEPSD